MNFPTIQSFQRLIQHWWSPEETIYTPSEDVKNIIEKRWEDKALKEKLDQYFGGDIPACLQERPYMVLVRHVLAANNETKRFLDLAEGAGLDPIGLEYNEDKFVSSNIDKHLLIIVPFGLGQRPDGTFKRVKKIAVADVNKAQGKPLTSILTHWNTPLVDFHHEILFECFPELDERIYDISGWLARHGGKARDFYEHFLALFVRNGVLVEEFQFEGREAAFTREVVIPAFERVRTQFGVTPLIVKLAPSNHKENPHWWYYPEHTREVMKRVIEEKSNA
jgi:hypothetical protein